MKTSSLKRLATFVSIVFSIVLTVAVEVRAETVNAGITLNEAMGKTGPTSLPPVASPLVSHPAKITNQDNESRESTTYIILMVGVGMVLVTGAFGLRQCFKIGEKKGRRYKSYTVKH